MAQENTVIAPYTPLVVSDSGISLLGRKLILNKDGFPAQIQTFFTPEMTSIGSTPNNLFAEAVHFHFYDAKGKQPTFLAQQQVRLSLNIYIYIYIKGGYFKET